MAKDKQEKSEAEIPEADAKKSVFSSRNLFVFLGVSAVSLILISLITYGLYRFGVFDRYIKDQFVAKMEEIGVEFKAETFRVAASPLELVLREATFNDKLTGEKLFYVRDARLGLTVLDLFAWRMSRDINIDSSDINGAEVWVRFDENGKSNFSNLKFVEDEKGGAVNFKYESVNVAIRDSTIHFGDLSRSISGNGKNLAIFLSPTDTKTAEGETRYKFDLTSTDSNFVYDGKEVEKIDIRAAGIADNKGAEITTFDIRTPLGNTSMSGTLTDWAAPKYELDITSMLDLTQTSTTFSTGTALRGVGNFRGHVSGQGENYRIEGTADSEALRADGVYLKAVNVAATVEGTNSNYNANGTAVAEMLTFDMFRVDFLRLNGNVRGTGTDFRWVGDLQAIAAKSPGLTLGGLFLADAVAEYKDKQLIASVGNGRAQKFAIGDSEFDDLRTRNLKFSMPGNNVDISAASATAQAFVTEDYRLNGVTGQNLRVRNSNGKTDVEASNLRSKTAKIAGANIDDLAAGKFELRDRPNSTGVSLKDIRARRVESDGTYIYGVESPEITIDNTNGTTVVYADRSRVAKIDTGSAVLGSLNIAGVRLTIRNGTIEGRSNDIDAGNIALTRNRENPAGGNLEAVKINRPVFTVERSGRYRATADMSIGGGMLGSVALGSATAKVNINNDRAELSELAANVMDGRLDGVITIAFDNRTQSKIDAKFADLDMSKLAALQSGRIIPIEGNTTGEAHFTFQGTNLRTASGTLDAAITATAGKDESARIPINGEIGLRADEGLFEIEKAEFSTGKSTLTALGRFDLNDHDSNLTVALRSDDANEVQRFAEVTEILPELDRQFRTMEMQFAGKLVFDGTITGDLYDPSVAGIASVGSLIMRNRELGSVATNINVYPDDMTDANGILHLAGVELRNGKLTETLGGTALFEILIPSGGANNVTVIADLRGIDAGNLLASLPIDLPSRISDLNGKTTGTVNITGLPDNANGAIDLLTLKGTVAGQNFDNLKIVATFRGSGIIIDTAEMRIGEGQVTAKGTYDRKSTAFDLDLTGKQVPMPILLAFLPPNENIPVITGAVDVTAKAVGLGENSSTFNFAFDGIARAVTVGENAVGEVTFKGQTLDQILSAKLTANLEGSTQIIDGSLSFRDENLPYSVTTVFDRSPLSPYIAFVPQLKGYPITGTGTGRIELNGTLRSRNSNGELVFSTSSASGSAQFSQLALTIQDTPLAAAEPISIKFDRNKVDFENAKFAGGGSNMTVSGTIALTKESSSNLTVDGQISLNLLNLATEDTFFAGNAEVAIRYIGPYETARLSGTAYTENASVAAFIGTDRLTLERIKTRVVFTADQAEIEDATGYLGGGKFTATGGALLKGLSVSTFRLSLNGDNVTVPLPQDFLTTGDARLEITGIRNIPKDSLQITIGGRVFAKRSLYSKDIDLANLVGARRPKSLSGGNGTASPPRFDLIIEGRDALIVRNNIADLTASASLVLTGEANEPRLTGRITANSGTLFYRKDRYEIQRGTLEFPPDSEIEPIINLQAETEIGGYQIFVNLAGPLKDTERLAATVRSSPALPSDDVVSLITTGSLSNTAGGIPTLAQSGINTAAEILTDSIINNPARKATDKLFGLNVFEIDPIISGNQINPSARLTVGRQINNNLRVTYSTNLSQDQNQVLALEYRVSNKLSFVAQYEQRSISNVTRNRDNFSFEIRFRRRF